MSAMSTFLVEVYLPAGNDSRFAAAAGRARDAATGAGLRYVRSIFIPAEETCFHLYEADCCDTLQRAVDRAAITVTRIVDGISLAPEADRGPAPEGLGISQTRMPAPRRDDRRRPETTHEERP